MVIFYTDRYGGNIGESHSLLQTALEAYLRLMRKSEQAGCSEEAASLAASVETTGNFGKPVIPGFAPFSISHSGNTWAVLIDREAESCGLDIQYPRKVEASALAGRFFAPEEQALLSSISGDTEQNAAFFRIWTRREALVKAAGTSVAGTDIPPVTEEEAHYEGRHYHLADINMPIEGLHAAVCTTGEMTLPDIIQL